jgi:hypothetical protein
MQGTMNVKPINKEFDAVTFSRNFPQYLKGFRKKYINSCSKIIKSMVKKHNLFYD